jgi:hypothetical protein
MHPGHPFAREGEHDVAIFEFGCHCKRGRTLHPKESHPRDPEEEKVSGKKKARNDVVFVADFHRFYPILIISGIASERRKAHFESGISGASLFWCLPGGWEWQNEIKSSRTSND